MTEDLKAKAEALKASVVHDEVTYLKRISDRLEKIENALSMVTNYMANAEQEVSEKMRRFIMYMHDVHDIVYMYEERGLPPPNYLMREMERCDDRLRQLLQEEHTDGGTFEKVRREMAADPENKWDHSRELTFKPQGL